MRFISTITAGATGTQLERYGSDKRGVDDGGGEGRTRAEFEQGDRINDFCVSRKNEDIPGVHGGGEGQRNMKIRASKSVRSSIYVYTFINKHEA